MAYYGVFIPDETKRASLENGKCSNVKNQKTRTWNTHREFDFFA